MKPAWAGNLCSNDSEQKKEYQGEIDIIVKENVGSEKILFQTNLSEKIWVKQKFGSKKLFCEPTLFVTIQHFILSKNYYNLANFEGILDFFLGMITEQ